MTDKMRSLEGCYPILYPCPHWTMQDPDPAKRFTCDKGADCTCDLGMFVPEPHLEEANK